MSAAVAGSADSRMLRAAVIGLGVGRQHAVGYGLHPRCRVAALCDIDPETLVRVGAEFPEAKRFTRAEEVLDDPDIDLVSIASYDNHHYGQVMQALRNGKHVFVEKPLCLHEHELAHIRELSRRRPELVFSSNLILRRSPRFLQLKSLVEAGDFGRIYCVEADYNYGRLHKILDGWRGALDYYSVFLGGGVHVADLALWLTGAVPRRVSALGNNLATAGSGFRFNDLTAGLVECEDGTILKLGANFACVYPHFHKLSVYGSRLTFENGLAHGLLFRSREPGEAPQRLDAPYPGVAKHALLTGFVDAVLGRRPADPSAEEVFRVMSLCLAVERSVRDKTIIEITDA